MFPALLATVLYAFSALSSRRLFHFYSGTQANFYRLFLKHHGLPPKRWAAEAGKATAR